MEANPIPTLKWFLNGEEIRITGAPEEPFVTSYEAVPGKEHTYMFYFKLNEVFPEDAGFWMVFLSNDCGTARCKAVLKVSDIQGIPPRMIHPMEKLYKVDLGRNFCLKFKVEGEPVPSLLWSFGGTEAAPASGQLEETDVEHPDGVEFTLNIKHISEDELGQGYAQELKISAVIEPKCLLKAHFRGHSF